MRRREWHFVLLMGACVLSLWAECDAAERDWPDRLVGTGRLELAEPLDVVMVRGISRFAEQELARSRERRQEKWQRDYGRSEEHTSELQSH